MASTKAYLLTATDQHGVQSPEEYQAEQLAYLTRANTRRTRTGDPPLAPWTPTEPPVVVVSGGAWVVRCVCGNAPSVHPTWKVARCFECGAVYQDVEIPADAAAIEDTLIQRPGKYRHYDPRRDDVLSLKKENKQAGLPHGQDDEQHGKPDTPPGKPPRWDTPLAHWSS